MEKIDKREFNLIKVPDDDPSKVPLMTQEELKNLEKSFNQPIEKQKELAAKIKIYIDKRMLQEFGEDEIISDHTRRWVELYHKLLDNLQKAIYGDKSRHIHEHHVSHAGIMMQMRKYDVIDVEVKDPEPDD